MNLDLIKQLREQTGAGFKNCQEALKQADGSLEKAQDILRKQGQKIAQKKQDRQAHEGIIDSYVHDGGKVGVLVEVNCETDFVARNDDFKKFVHEIALQIAAASPTYMKPEEVPEEVIAKEREVYQDQLAKEKKPKEIVEKIIEGKLEKFYSEVCLLKQPYIKDDTTTIEKLLVETIAKLGENITIGRFTRFNL